MHRRSDAGIRLALVLLFVALLGRDGVAATKQLLRQRTHGRLYRVSADAANSHYLLELSGTHYEMGYAHGRLMANEIIEAASMVCTGNVNAPEVPAEQHYTQAQKDWAFNHLFRSLPQRYQDELLGIHDGIFDERGGDFGGLSISILALRVREWVSGTRETASTGV